jgi:tetratricopeptide (TPR) repeat protein
VSRVLGLVALLAVAQQNVYVPPAPIGVASDAKVREARAIEFPAEKLRWIRIRSQHFDVISSATPERTQQIVSDLETMAAVLKRTNAHFQTSPVATTIFVFSDRAESVAWFDLLLGPSGRRLGGAYVRHAGGGTMIIDGANTRRIARTALHELVHDLLRQGERVPPLWLEEGLAEYFAVARVQEHRVEAGGSVPLHRALLRSVPRLMPLDTMFAVQPETPAATAPLFYAQSWAAVDWLMQLDSEVFYAFVEDLERGEPVERALEARYHKSLDALESAIRRRGGLTGTTVRFPNDARIAAAPPFDLDRATLLYELGRFLSVIAGAEGEAAKHYQEALRLDPKHARTLAALARYDEAIAAAPDDATVHLAYAESLMSTAIGPFAGMFEPAKEDGERFRRARKLAAHAHDLLRGSNSADEARALGDLGTSYLVEPNLGEGVTALERASAMLPRRNDFALNLYAMLLRSGERARADAFFAARFARSRDRQVVFAARNVLLSEEVRRANLLAHDGKFEEAAALVRQLAAATEEGKARGELESEAARLEGTAAVNRHIRMYNDAVTLANTNQYADALKILDAILKEATDAQVIEDAKRLRDELKKP